MVWPVRLSNTPTNPPCGSPRSGLAANHGDTLTMNTECPCRVPVFTYTSPRSRRSRGNITTRPLSANPALDSRNAAATGSIRSSKRTWTRSSAALTMRTALIAAARSRKCLENAATDERDVAADLHAFHSAGRTLRLHAQRARAARKSSLIQDEDFTASGEAVPKPIGSDGPRGASRRHVLDDAVVVPVPDFEPRLVQ